MCGCHTHAWGQLGRGCCHGHHHGGFHRRFLTTAEKKARLEEYFKELQAEVKAVEEKLKELGEGA
ncbi:hypothetical protein [Moorella sulfitireducens (nom. illeg.)]|uniref:hypothetical protein n=1 Tax=Neomoorella sulfitireducens TaxID=2972948 RepID=UPI0021ABD980|nr:hypothetical protein [Moorella sulfitireducens]